MAPAAQENEHALLAGELVVRDRVKDGRHLQRMHDLVQPGEAEAELLVGCRGHVVAVEPVLVRLPLQPGKAQALGADRVQIAAGQRLQGVDHEIVGEFLVARVQHGREHEFVRRFRQLSHGVRKLGMARLVWEALSKNPFSPDR